MEEKKRAYRQKIEIKDRKPKSRKNRGVKTKILDHQVSHQNVLKYYRVVMYWVKANYDLNQSDIDMLFFIYDIPLFTSSDFDEFAKMVSWDRNRFKRLKKDGWIVKYRAEGINKFALYRISPSGKRLISTCYRKLKGEEKFSESYYGNKVMQGRLSTDIIMARKMKEINERIRKYALEPKWVKGGQ